MNKTTKLDAVNGMLAAIGVRPVNTLQAPIGAQVSTAINVLDSVSRDVQSRGWYFNCVTKTLPPDGVSGQIVLAPNVLFVDATNRLLQYTQRGDYLYNLTDDTDVFEDAVEVALVYGLDWEQLPQAARHAIGKRAEREFVAKMKGERELRSPSADELQAFVDLEHSNSAQGDYNIFDNLAYARVIRRHSNPNMYGGW